MLWHSEHRRMLKAIATWVPAVGSSEAWPILPKKQKGHFGSTVPHAHGQAHRIGAFTEKQHLIQGTRHQWPQTRSPSWDEHLGFPGSPSSKPYLFRAVPMIRLMTLKNRINRLISESQINYLPIPTMVSHGRDSQILIVEGSIRSGLTFNGTESIVQLDTSRSICQCVCEPFCDF